MDLRVDTRFEHGRTIVTPHGEIDLSTVEVFRHELNELLIQGRVNILVDLDETSFVDSLGFGALVSARRKAQAFNGSLDIICSDERILRLFAITGLDRVFTISRTSEADPTPSAPASPSAAAPSTPAPSTAAPSTAAPGSGAR